MVIDAKSMLGVGDTLVPLIIMSSRTHLSNFVGHKTEWPVYMTIGNQSSKIRQMPLTHSIEIVAPLRIPIENHNIQQMRAEEQRQSNREVLNEVLRQILQPLTSEQNHSPERRSYNILCADGNCRHCEQV